MRSRTPRITSIVILGILLFASISCTQKNTERSYEHRTVVLLLGTQKTPPPDGALERLQAGHLANIRAMAETGNLYLAGPMQSVNQDSNVRGILVFGPLSEDLLSAITRGLESDPMISSGYLKATVHTLLYEPDNTLRHPLRTPR